jgi:predicted enzyme related to lactoylglutathione lyase
MITNTHFILYVNSQSISIEFYSKLLNQKPTLNVPGMTEFKLSEKVILGLMPSSGIKKLLENKIDIYNPAEKIAKAEVYIVVDNISEYYNRAVSLNATILSEIKERDWGHMVAYFLDPDNYIIAIAEIIN